MINIEKVVGHSENVSHSCCSDGQVLFIVDCAFGTWSNTIRLLGRMAWIWPDPQVKGQTIIPSGRTFVLKDLTVVLQGLISAARYTFRIAKGEHSGQYGIRVSDPPSSPFVEVFAEGFSLVAAAWISIP